MPLDVNVTDDMMTDDRTDDSADYDERTGSHPTAP